MHIIKRKSISKKIFLLMIIVSITSGSLILGISLIETLSTTEEHIIDHHKTITHVAARSIEAGYHNQSWPIATLEEVSECEGVLFWWIVKPDGEIMLADDDAMVGEQISERSLGTNKMIVEDSVFYKTGENIKLIVHPLEIEEDGKQWVFYVGVSLDHIIATRNALITNGVTILGVIIILAVFISAFFTRTITRPIMELTEGTEAISQGNLDYEIKMKSEDEIGKLADAFNKMTVDLKKSRDKIERYNKTLERLLNRKDEFIGQLGHDLKNPLTPLTALLPIVLEQEKDPKLKEYLKVIVNNVEYMRDLIFKTLQLAKLRSSTIEFDIKRLNLSEEVNNVLGTHQILLKENKMTVENKVKNNIFVLADKLRLTELFNNLITNAVKYTPEVNGTITIDAKKDDKFVTISVKDTGVGMTEKELSLIFDEFYKADKTVDEFVSSGLGLSIAKRIVEKHGGKLWVESPGKGKGSTFSFTLKSA